MMTVKIIVLVGAFFSKEILHSHATMPQANHRISSIISAFVKLKKKIARIFNFFQLKEDQSNLNLDKFSFSDLIIELAD